MKRYLLFLAAMALLLIPGNASAITSYCQNDTLITNITIDGRVIQIEDYCRYGCGEGTNPNGDECYQAPIITVTSAFTILIVFLALIFILPYTLKKRKKKGR